MNNIFTKSVFLILMIACLNVYGYASASDDDQGFFESLKKPFESLSNALSDFGKDFNTSNTGEDIKDVSDFDIQGAKLGMSDSEIRALFPNSKISFSDKCYGDHPYLRSNMKIEVEKDASHHTDIEVKYMDTPDGQRAVSIEYLTGFKQHLDPATAIALKRKVIEKYGRPRQESQIPKRRATPWYAWYGVSGPMKRKISSLDMQRESKDSPVVCGKQLQASIDNYRFSLILTDTCPEANLQRERKARAADVKF